MGDQNAQELTANGLRQFSRNLLDDMRAFELLLASDMIETGIRRIGVEQELFLIDEYGRPACTAMEILREIGESRYTTELGLFNLEINLDPIPFSGNCLWQMEQRLTEYIAKVQEIASRFDTRVLLTGILPTLRKSDMKLANLTPVPRYLALDNALRKLRGSDYEFRIEGIDQLILKHKSVMLESCNTSFQLHFQVTAKEFARFYNLAQAITAPLLAVAVNSPLLFGHRLWKETRIACFQQAVDTRGSRYELRNRFGRVYFGSNWVENSVVELFRENVERFRVLLGADIDEDPFVLLEQQKPPQFRCLQLHNGTIYRWNRACYGSTGEIAHLRIENRVLPSGPTILDEVANAAFFFGMMNGIPDHYPDVAEIMDFEQVRNNFIAAARYGLESQFVWEGGKLYPAQQLILAELLPLARSGLQKAGIDGIDIDRYLGVIEKRTKSRRTGATWMLESLSNAKRVPLYQALRALVDKTWQNQQRGLPIHEWEMAQLQVSYRENPLQIDSLVTRDLFTVHPQELVDMVAYMMNWRRIRHMPVEDEAGNIVGIISCRDILRYFADTPRRDELLAVADIMVPEVVTISLETTILEAIDALLSNKVGCLPVVEEDTLIAILSQRDFSRISLPLLEEKIREGENNKRFIVGRQMAKNGIAVREECDLITAARQMLANDLLQITVVDSHDNLQGVISYRKFLQLFARRTDLSTLTAACVMVKKPVCASLKTPTLEAFRLMNNHKIGCLPIVEDRKLIGMVTESDYAKIALCLLEEKLN